ncbi:MAG: anaerobic ribonucleoside-triphosphate reductase activating protein, partial [Clostridiales bacterium]|nr:anaerobic ribonucleoside-triphosphate reductase activating protein [Clostridiales bacterium]
MGYLVKLDTNGSHPKIIRDLLDQKLLDYIAMDIKSDLSHYTQVTQSDQIKPEVIEESVNILKDCTVDYEFRTTVVKELHN